MKPSSGPGQTHQPQNLEFVHKAADALRADDLARALELAREGLEKGCIHPLLLNLRAFWFEQQGHDTEALADLQRAVSLAPDDAPAQNAYGLALAKAQRLNESIAAFRAAVGLQPDFAQAHYNLGWALEAIASLGDAGRAYLDAVKCDPKSIEPIARLANLAARAGSWEEARGYARQARAIDPLHNMALTAECSAAIASGEFAEAEKLLEASQAASAERPLDLALSHVVKGDLRHAQRRYPEAFAAYSHANAAQRDIYAGQFERQGQETAYDNVASLRSYFEAAGDWSPASRPDPSIERAGAAGHVFLVGFPRSGTTLAENILASHPAIVALEEKPTLNDAVRDFLSDARALNRLAILPAPDIERYRKTYWHQVAGYLGSVEGKVFVDKHPLNSVKLPIVAKLFPNAKILFALRDPRDVVLSCFRRTFQMNASMFEFLSLERAARFYDAVMSLSELYRHKLGLDGYELRHEPLVEDIEGRMRAVCEFLNLAWSPEMLDFAQRSKTRFIATPSSTQVVRGLNREGMGQWLNYRSEMDAVLPVLRPWVERLGYGAS